MIRVACPAPARYSLTLAPSFALMAGCTRAPCTSRRSPPKVGVRAYVTPAGRSKTTRVTLPWLLTRGLPKVAVLSGVAGTLAGVTAPEVVMGARLGMLMPGAPGVKGVAP